MRVAYILIFITSIINASITSYFDEQRAKDAYAKKSYKVASKNYQELAKSGEQKAIYNYANTLYKDSNYSAAIKQYKRVNQDNLKPKALYNMGNAYAYSGKLKEAIKAYEESLKLKESQATKHNLEEVKKALKKREHKEKKKRNQDKKDNKKQNKKKEDNKENKKNF